MRLLSFKYKNLFSLGEGELDLQSLGLTLITGYSEDEGSSNGAGKSSLANKGIVWTLFGETVGGLKADAVLNRHGKRKCFGAIDFVGKDGDTYTIKRERPAKLSLFKSDKDISAHTAKDTQSIIDPLLGFDFKTFVQTSVFGQGRNVHYPSLPPKEQKAVLEQILPMEEIDRWASIADIEIKKLKPNLDDIMNKYHQAQGRYTTLNDQLFQTHKDGETFEASRRIKKEQALAKLHQIERDFNFRLQEINQEIKGFDREQLEIKLFELNLRLNEITTELHLTEGKLSKSFAVKEDWLRNAQRIIRENEKLNTSTKCPVCLRDYDESTIQAVKLKAIELSDSLTACQKNIIDCYTATNYYASKKDQLETLRAKLEYKKGINIHFLLRFDQYQNKIDGLKRNKSIDEAGPRAILETVEIEINPYVTTVKRLEKETKESKEVMDSLYIKHKTLNDELEHLLYWRDVYGKELKLKLFEDTCPFLDTRTAYHLERLQNKQIHCDFSTIKRLSTGTTKEEFTVDVWSETGGRGFESLSGGEQQMVSFAISLALADLASAVAGAKSGIFILDEPFTELDERNHEAIVEYLTAEIGNGKDTILLISNDETLKGLIQNRIHVIKSKGVTHVS